MKIAGIISEYNPLHAGHIYHIEQTRRRTQCDYVICAMDGCFTQRGDAALFDKFARVEMALHAGIDAVFELPVTYALRPAELFARGGVGVLSALGIDVLSFGCESEDGDALNTALETLASLEKENHELLRNALSKGLSYPEAVTRAVMELSPETANLMREPNFVLALEYLKEIKRLNADIEICPILRSAPYNAQSETNLSASGIRRMLMDGKTMEAISGLPKPVAELYMRELDGGAPDNEKLDNLLLSLLRRACKPQSTDDAEGLFGRLQAAAKTSASYLEALEKTKCKRYTLSRIKRLGLCAALKLPAPSEQPYLRLIGAKESSKPLLAELKRRSGGKIVTRASLLSDNLLFQAECRATELWGLATDRREYRLAGREYTQQFIKR